MQNKSSLPPKLLAQYGTSSLVCPKVLPRHSFFLTALGQRTDGALKKPDTDALRPQYHQQFIHAPSRCPKTHYNTSLKFWTNFPQSANTRSASHLIKSRNRAWSRSQKIGARYNDLQPQKRQDSQKKISYTQWLPNKIGKRRKTRKRKFKKESKQKRYKSTENKKTRWFTTRSKPILVTIVWSLNNPMSCQDTYILNRQLTYTPMDLPSLYRGSEWL